LINKNYYYYIYIFCILKDKVNVDDDVEVNNNRKSNLLMNIYMYYFFYQIKNNKNILFNILNIGISFINIFYYYISENGKANCYYDPEDLLKMNIDLKKKINSLIKDRNKLITEVRSSEENRTRLEQKCNDIIRTTANVMKKDIYFKNYSFFYIR